MVNGADFDPFIDYSVSVIARHNPESLEHQSPNGREFAARVFTGVFKRKQPSSSGIAGSEAVVGDGFKEAFVSPNACCGYSMYGGVGMSKI